MTDEPLVGVLLAGKYRIKRCIGRGGMGAVYEAENVDFGKRVAIKIIEPQLGASSEMATRFRQAARTLARAHAAGVVHRDLKPGNLFLAARADGAVHVKILDFGISKLQLAESADEGSSASSKANHLTRVGTLLGTPQYMSPEQA